MTILNEPVNIKKMPLWLIALAVAVPTFFAFLGTSATNVALPHIAGSFGSTSDESKWVVTSYMIAIGVFLPLTGWLEQKLGRVGFLEIFIGIFTVGSIICTIAPNLLTLIIGRIIQGIGGGVLMPISQSVLLQEFPNDKKGEAMAIFVFSSMMSAIVGPTVGGFLVDNFSWRWIFIINIPIGILSLIAIPMILNDTVKIKTKEKVDFLGVVFLVLWLFSMQVVLDKGQQYGWFDCTWIYWLSVFSLFFMLLFIIWELEVEKPIVDLRVFKKMNFVIGTTLGTLVNVMVCGTMILLPQFFQGLMHYTAFDTGYALIPRAFACIVLLFIGRLCQIFDMKLIIAAGFLITGIAITFCIDLNMQVSSSAIILSNILFGIGTATALVPISGVSVGTLPKEQIASAAGIHGLAKSVGGSVATSIASSFTIGLSQIHQTYLLKNMNIYNHNFQNHFNALKGAFLHHFDIVTATNKANLSLYNQLIAQSKLCAISDLFAACAIITFLAIPLVVFLKTNNKN